MLSMVRANEAQWRIALLSVLGSIPFARERSDELDRLAQEELMKRRVLCVLSLFALAAACGGRSTEVLDNESSDQTIALDRIALRGSLPSCGASTAGAVYYVAQDERLVYCDGNSHQDVQLDCAPTWLVSAGTAASCAHGGSTLSVGPDKDRNGQLDKQEIVASATACNGAPGAPGTGGRGGAPGTTPGVTNPTGEGQPCVSDADCAGFDASFCELFVSHTCLVRGCSVAPDSCSSGRECCDLTAFGLPTLCLGAGLCAN